MLAASFLSVLDQGLVRLSHLLLAQLDFVVLHELLGVLIIDARHRQANDVVDFADDRKRNEAHEQLLNIILTFLLREHDANESHLGGHTSAYLEEAEERGVVEAVAAERPRIVLHVVHHVLAQHHLGHDKDVQEERADDASKVEPCRRAVLNLQTAMLIK